MTTCLQVCPKFLDGILKALVKLYIESSKPKCSSSGSWDGNAGKDEQGDANVKLAEAAARFAEIADPCPCSYIYRMYLG